MPNQLSKTKERRTWAEHRAVLASLEVIAEHRGTTVSDLLRHASRRLVREYGMDPGLRPALQAAVEACAPAMPHQLQTPAQVARFKRAQREFDKIKLELQLERPEEIQARNSIVIGNAQSPVHVMELDPYHA